MDRERERERERNMVGGLLLKQDGGEGRENKGTEGWGAEEEKEKEEEEEGDNGLFF